VQRPETVAEHTFRTALIAGALAAEELETPRACAWLALLHDLPETRTLDLHRVAQAYVKDDEKKAKKDQASLLPKNLQALFLEEPTPKQKQIVKDADLLELALTAKEYESLGYREAEAWRKNAGKKLKTKTAKKWFAGIERADPSRWYLQVKHGLMK
ncbi:MAG TPA: HD domain-containing protein, partial [Candidatus Norongarragalinales archaeon]|nr:HD domain-containing protein [Candidatus Norongarragalinales archaeon]